VHSLLETDFQVASEKSHRIIVEHIEHMSYLLLEEYTRNFCSVLNCQKNEELLIEKKSFY